METRKCQPPVNVHGSHPCCEEMGDCFPPAAWEESRCSWWKRGGKKLPWGRPPKPGAGHAAQDKSLFPMNFELASYLGIKWCLKYTSPLNSLNRSCFSSENKTQVAERCSGLVMTMSFTHRSTTFANFTSPLLFCPECSLHVSARRAGHGQFGVVTISPWVCGTVSPPTRTSGYQHGSGSVTCLLNVGSVTYIWWPW